LFGHGCGIRLCILDSATAVRLDSGNRSSGIDVVSGKKEARRSETEIINRSY